ncbi:unnamed protein product [Phyllotreta striolata]|uniref:Ankyrin repeat domain-containing protein 12 n=1 Tax=Phyllotreta striolata TaxID=444603 RepID=A0A9N9XIU9_PHYSR|nr:unnamed protein product [Phyllotreta striolata]
MPAPIRPKGSNSGSRTPTVAPMSERQQMALLMQMTSGSESGSRSPSSSSSRSRERNERGETPLHLAAIKGDLEQVCKLLAHRADPNVADFAGWTPLHEACNHGWYEVAFRLLQSGANVNARGLDNDTPLHDAVINSHLKLVKLLVERGADIYAKNSKGKTPLDVAPANVKPYLLNANLPLPDCSSSSRQASRTSRDDKKISNAGSSDSSTSSNAGGGGSGAASGGGTSSGKHSKEDSMDLKGSAGATTASGAPAGGAGGSGSAAAVDDVYEFKSSKEGDSSSDERKPSAASDSNEMEVDEGDPLKITPAASQPSEECGAKRGFSEANEAQEESGGGAGATDDETRRKKRKEETAREGKGSNPRNAGQNKGQANKQSSGNQSKTTASSASKNSGDKKSPCASPKLSGSDHEVEDGKSDLKVPPLKIVIPQTTSNEQETGAGRNGKSSSQRSHQALPYVVPSSSNTEAAEKDGTAAIASPESATAANKNDEKKENNSGNSDEVQSNTEVDSTPSSSASTSAALPPPPAPVELHPRKRKMKQNKEHQPPQHAESSESSETQVHPHEQPITNCYQLFLNIRKQIAKRRRGLFPVQPKPPQGFKDYLMNRCTYVLAGTAPTSPNINYPQTLPQLMKDLFTEQEKERYRLRTQHVIEKEKLVLSVEQEILRVHGRAARALANQSLPFSVCTILGDEEVYNLITPEQEEKDRNARWRYNGRLFLSWLQDVDDKWEKIKEHMLLRHHNEAESLHAVQKMDWEWKQKDLNLCDRKSTLKIDETHVPMVHVSDDFDLLPA